MTFHDSSRGVWEGEQYAAQAWHHRSFDDWFLDRHPPRPDDHVVDAGCGSGEFTARLARVVAEGEVIGVEPDPSMLAAARRHTAGNLEFRQGRLQELDHVCTPSRADLVVSRAVFHWIPITDYRRCYEAVFNVLTPGGWFHAESGGAGNVRQVADVLDEVALQVGLRPAAATFPDAGVAFDLLSQAGFEVPPSGVTTVAQRRPFDRDQLAGFLRTQASPAYLAGASEEARQAFVARMEERLETLRRDDGSYDQTFVRLDVLCRRPD